MCETTSTRATGALTRLGAGSRHEWAIRGMIKLGIEYADKARTESSRDVGALKIASGWVLQGQGLIHDDEVGIVERGAPSP